MLGAMLCAGGCVKEISSEERLERETNLGPAIDVPTAEELAKVSCLNAPQELTQARNESRPETERIQQYIAIYESLKKRTSQFELAMARNPDLAYQEGSQKLVAAQEACVEQLADARVEFDRYVRELVEVPIVQDVKGGRNVNIARVDFDVLRDAIEILGPDDKDQLLARVTTAEEKVESKPARRKRK